MKKYTFLISIFVSNLGYAQQAQNSFEYRLPSSSSYYTNSYQQSSLETQAQTQTNPNTINQPGNTDAKQGGKLTSENEAKKTDETKAEKPETNKKEIEKPKSPHTFTANVSIVSDYRFRGISQTMRRPAIQGGFDYSNTSGIYLGTWGSNVDGTTHFYNNTSIEWDFYIGYKGKFSCIEPDLQYNLGLIYYYYPGGKVLNLHNTRYNTLEVYLEIVYKWLSIKYWQTLSNYFGICSNNTAFNWEDNIADRLNKSSRGSTYIEVNASFDLLDKVCYRCLEAGKLNLLLHVGHQTVRHYSHLNYTDWRATLTQELAWINVFITYVGTNAKHAYYNVPDNGFHPHKHSLGAQGVVVGVIKTF